MAKKIDFEGDFVGVVKSVDFYEDRYKRGDGSINIALRIETPKDEWIEIIMDISNDYVPNCTPPMTRTQHTYKALRRIGWRGNGEIAAIETDIVGKEVGFYTKISTNGKYVNGYLSFGPVGKKADDIEMQGRLKSLFAGCDDDGEVAPASVPAASAAVFDDDEPPF